MLSFLKKTGFLENPGPANTDITKEVSDRKTTNAINQI